MMNRRNFLKALTVTAAGIAVPELIVPEKRFWALDRTMLGREYIETGWFDGSFEPITRYPKMLESWVEWQSSDGCEYPSPSFRTSTITIENPGVFRHPDNRLIRMGVGNDAEFVWIDRINADGSLVIHTWDGTIVST
jgi:hypothetical protein